VELGEAPVCSQVQFMSGILEFSGLRERLHEFLTLGSLKPGNSLGATFLFSEPVDGSGGRPLSSAWIANKAPVETPSPAQMI